jgi:hypothetical protein
VESEPVPAGAGAGEWAVLDPGAPDDSGRSPSGPEAAGSGG